MSRIDGRFIKHVAIGDGTLGKGGTQEEAVAHLFNVLGYTPKNYDVYYVVGKKDADLRVGIFEGMMLWSPGAERTRTLKVRNGNRCYIGEVVA